jgi:hypothetical protein
MRARCVDVAPERRQGRAFIPRQTTPFSVDFNLTSPPTHTHIPRAASPWHRGIVFGGDEWSSPLYPYGSSGSADSLAALAATGATHVRVLVTWFVDSINTTTIYPIQGPSPLASSTLAQVNSTLRLAMSLGLNVTLCPIIDPSWDLPTVNGRSVDAPNFSSRLQIGTYYSESDWQAFFASYRAYVLPFAQLAESTDGGVALFEIGSELDVAFAQREADWRSFVADLRKVYSGPLSAAMDIGQVTAGKVAWLDALDFIGVDAYQSLGQNLNLGTAPAVADLVQAWQPTIDLLAAASAKFGNKPVLLTEVGYQSRPSCHVRPWGTVDRDPLDDSAWIEDHDPACQANAYEALFQALTPLPWFKGVYFWLWRSDPSHGGTGDSDFTPHGKPAEVVLRRWYGNFSGVACPDDGAYAAGGVAAHPAAPFRIHAVPGDAECDGSAAVARAVSAQTRAAVEAGRALQRARREKSVPAAVTTTKKTFNGFCLGGPDEWSSPYYRFDSQGARDSLASMASLGADSVEVIVQWYYAGVNSTEVYPIVDPSSPMMTSTDDELLSIMAYARTLGLTVLLTPMLDPDWTLPEQNNCRGETNQGICRWRGQLGMYFPPNECGAGSQWGAFFDGYEAMLVHYARLAEQAGAAAFLTSHELQTAVSVCPDRWASIVSSVRAVYSGNVTAAFQPNLLDPASLAPLLPWITTLDFSGIDCYLSWPQPPHPALPWNDTSLSTLVQALDTYMAGFANLSAAIGHKIVCTEVGWASRPWTYTGAAGIAKLDPEDCSVWDQCVSMDAHALAYEAFFSTFYAQPWFDGVLFWTWRADPTVGGTSDDGFAPTGKPSAATIASYWLPQA